MSAMSYSKTGLALTEQFEGLSLVAYQDVTGVWTIGYGHTGKGIVEGMTITREQAEAFLESDIAAAAAYVNKVVEVPLTQNEFDALVDFVFNVGPAAFGHSALLTKLNEGKTLAAAAQFSLWDHAGGKVVAGLLRRRVAEEQLFEAR